MSEFPNLDKLVRDIRSGRAARRQWTIVGLLLLLMFICVVLVAALIWSGNSLKGTP